MCCGKCNRSLPTRRAVWAARANGAAGIPDARPASSRNAWAAGSSAGHAWPLCKSRILVHHVENIEQATIRPYELLMLCRSCLKLQMALYHAVKQVQWNFVATRLNASGPRVAAAA
jgi:hypothetical protein